MQLGMNIVPLAAMISLLIVIIPYTISGDNEILS